MRYTLQNIAFRFLHDAAIVLSIQDPSETNAILSGHGVTEYNFRSFAPSQLARMLGVEYVLIGMVSQETEAIRTISNSRSVNTRHDRHYHHHQRRNERYYRTNVVTSHQINTTVDIAIYNDNGNQVFGRSRRSLLTNMDTYKAGLQYLLKRTPLYNK
jgi:hypothetical protein